METQLAHVLLGERLKVLRQGYIYKATPIGRYHEYPHSQLFFRVLQLSVQVPQCFLQILMLIALVV